MDQQSRPGLLSVVSESVQTFFQLTKDILKLAQAEASLAKQSMVKLAIVYTLLSLFLLSTWISALALLVAVLLSYQMSWIAAFSLILGLHVIGIVIFCLIVMKLKRNMTFQATRKQLSRLRS